MSRSRLGGIAVVLLLAGAAWAAPREYVQETDHVRVVYYDPAHEYLVRYVLQCFENAFGFERVLLRYTPTEKVTILLDDLSDNGHGAAGTLPRNYISVAIGPLSHAYETLPANDRVSWIVSHELVHIITSDNATRRDRFFRQIFGGKVAPAAEDPISMFFSTLTSPRHYSPRWWHEGVATFFETWMSGGVGRALGGFDEMVFRTMVRDGAHIYDAVGLESEGSSIDYQVGANAYLYGTRFLTWLCREYGPEKLLQWVVRAPGSRAYFAAQFRTVYGASLTDEWRKWIAAERRWQTANLERIAAFPVTRVRSISNRALGSMSRAYYDPAAKRIYAAVRYPGAMAHLASIDPETGAYERLTEVHGPALYSVSSVAFDLEGRRLFYTSDNVQFRGLNVYDLRTRRSTRLIRNYRTGDLVYSRPAGGLWGVRYANGLIWLVRSAAPFRDVQPVYQFDYGSEFFDIDISPDGVWLSGAMSDSEGKQKLVRARIADLLAGKAEFQTVYDFGYNSPGNFVYSPDGRYLYGSSFYTGVSNLFRIDPGSPTLEALSNSDTGLFRPLPLPDGRLLAMQYTAAGFLPGWADTRQLTDVNAVPYLGQAAFEKHPLLKQWKLSSPASIAVDPLIRNATTYRPLQATGLKSVIPVVQGYKSSPAAGVRLDFGDSIHLARGYFTAAWSPDSSLPRHERLHATLEANWWNSKVTVAYNPSNFYDLVGPTKVSRRGWSARFERYRALRYEHTRTLSLEWAVAGYAGLDRLPDYQNVAVTHTRFLTAKADLNYANKRKSLGAVEDEAGAAWAVRSKLYFTGRDFFPQIQASGERGWLVPLRNSSVWLRGAAGQAFGRSSDPFGNFYFGGFGNNWIDHQSIARYRESYALPGVGLNAVGANRFGRAQGEWDLPPRRFQRLGTAAAYLTWARVALFSSVLTGRGAQGGRFVGDAGAQLDLRIVLRTYLDTTLSGGYAVAIDDRGRRSGGYMVSLKIQ